MAVQKTQQPELESPGAGCGGIPRPSSYPNEAGGTSDKMTISVREYEEQLERASIALAMYRDLQAAVRVWGRLREHQLHLLEQCESIEATRDAAPVIKASMVTLAECISDIERILRRYGAVDPAARGGGDADAPASA